MSILDKIPNKKIHLLLEYKIPQKIKVRPKTTATNSRAQTRHTHQRKGG